MGSCRGACLVREAPRGLAVCEVLARPDREFLALYQGRNPDDLLVRRGVLGRHRGLSRSRAFDAIDLA